MEGRIGNPQAIGFGALGMAAWMFSLANAGWYTGAANAPVINQVVGFVVFVLVITTVMSYLRNDTWHGAFFMLWAAVIWGIHMTMGGSGMAGGGYGAWYNILVALLSLCLLLSGRKAAPGLPMLLYNLAITITFVLFALGGWFGAAALMKVAGYTGLIAGLGMLWASWAGFAAMGGGGAPAAG